MRGDETWVREGKNGNGEGRGKGAMKENRSINGRDEEEGGGEPDCGKSKRRESVSAFVSFGSKLS